MELWFRMREVQPLKKHIKDKITQYNIMKKKSETKFVINILQISFFLDPWLILNDYSDEKATDIHPSICYDKMN